MAEAEPIRKRNCQKLVSFRILGFAAQLSQDFEILVLLPYLYALFETGNLSPLHVKQNK